MRKIANKSCLKYSIETIKQFIIENKIKVELISTEYVNYVSKLKWKCSCGNEFETSLCKFLTRNKRQCNVCGKKNIANSKKQGIKKIKQVVLEHNLKPLFQEYKSIDEPLLCEDKSGYKVYPTISNLRKNKIPQAFYHKNPFYIDNVNNYIKINKLDCRALEIIKPKENPIILFECVCGEIFKTSSEVFFAGKKCRCDKCTNSQSKYSLMVQKFLDENFLLYSKEFSFSDCKDIKVLRFDYIVYTEVGNVLIEVDGELHYKQTTLGNNLKEQKRKDRIKDDYCKNKNIKLIRIPYWEFKNGNYIKILNVNLLNQLVLRTS